MLFKVCEQRRLTRKEEEKRKKKTPLSPFLFSYTRVNTEKGDESNRKKKRVFLVRLKNEFLFLFFFFPNEIIRTWKKKKGRTTRSSLSLYDRLGGGGGFRNAATRWS